jgi:hypothetical protein
MIRQDRASPNRGHLKSRQHGNTERNFTRHRLSFFEVGEFAVFDFDFVVCCGERHFTLPDKTNTRTTVNSEPSEF